MPRDRRDHLRVPRGVLGTLPPTVWDRGASTPGAAKSLRVPRSRTASGVARVLLVEPSPVLRAIFTRAFAARGHTVTATGTLSDTYRLLDHFDPHIVVAELILSDGRGDIACKRIKTRADKLRPVVLVSAGPEVELAHSAADAGADRFHNKSRGLEELVELVEELVAEIVF